MNGWFKFHRKIFENPICNKDSEYFHVWCWILANVEFEEKRVLFGGNDIILQKGQMITTSKEIAQSLNINESKVRRILKSLENAKQIDRQTSTKNSLITVVNWNLYQNSDGQNNERVTDKWQTTDVQVTDERQTSSEPSYYIKNKRTEEKEEDKKEDKPKKKEPTVYYPNDELLDSAFKEFLVMRNKIKKPIATKQALTRMMNRIEKLSGGDNDLAIKILNQSTDHCWQDVYELKEDNNGQANGKSKIDWSKV
ncbi:MAG: Rrf2 family transcriptional regulator [Lachnospiraceae bacterium]|nr:Rrf2 family transcriptional regulator [Lachnospiraceae bacterium]